MWLIWASREDWGLDVGCWMLDVGVDLCCLFGVDYVVVCVDYNGGECGCLFWIVGFEFY